MSQFGNIINNLFGDGKKKSGKNSARPNNSPNARQQGGSQPVRDRRGDRRQNSAMRRNNAQNINTRQNMQISGVNAGAGAAAAQKKPGFLTRFFSQEKFDFSFFLIVIILLAFGIVMLFSSSFASAKYKYNDSMYFVKRQLIFAGIGLFAMLFASTVDYHFFMRKPVIKIAAVGSVGLMMLVKVIGKTLGGAERWIEVGGITIQPSEILKFVTIMVIAAYMQDHYDRLDDFKTGFLPVLIRVVVACALVVFQPHLSATAIILVISICMLFIGGAKYSHMALFLLLIVVGMALVIWVFPLMGLDYVSTRFLSWRDPEADIGDKTYQTYQSLITIGSGGMFGLGLGNSRQKYSYLPVTENDFIFSVIVEELGFVGAVLVVLLFVILMVRGFYIASKAPDKFGMLLCVGIVVQIGVQAFLNIAVTSNAIPNTGVSLPFISYGGTALLMQLGEMGVVLNISRKAAIE